MIYYGCSCKLDLLAVRVLRGSQLLWSVSVGKWGLVIDGDIHEQIGDDAAEDLATGHSPRSGSRFEGNGLPPGQQQLKFNNLMVRSGRVAVTVGCSREISIDEKCHRNNVSEMSIRVFLTVLLTVSENRRVHQDFVKPSYT